MRKNLLILFVFSMIFSQSNMTTPMGSPGFGIWTTFTQPFKGSQTTGSIRLDLHLRFGVEFSFGQSFEANTEYVFNHVGVAYDVKLYEWGSRLYAKRYDIDDFDFAKRYEKEESGLEIYRRGRKLNSFLRFNQYKYNDLANHVINIPYDSFLMIGGVGRMTRFITLAFGLSMPIEKLFYIRYSNIEATFGTSF